MIAQYRPEIARVAEETVLNLKELETRIEVLRNELAQFCAAVGHPQAAQLALSPAGIVAGRGMGIGATSFPTFGQGVPYQGAYQGITPFATFGQGFSPFQGVSPWAFGQGFAPFQGTLGFGAMPYYNPLVR